MANWKQLLINVLIEDGVIDATETNLIEKEIMADGVADDEEIDFLVELRNTSVAKSEAFEMMFFKILETNFLEDGIIDEVEAKKIREILYADGVIDANEKVFLADLKMKAKSVCPDFDALLAEINN